MMLAVNVACARPQQQCGDYLAYFVKPDGHATPQNNRWARYLYTHLNNRTGRIGLVYADRPDRTPYLRVNVELDASLSTDYAVKRTDNCLTLRARTDEAMLWLIYQFLSAAADEDSRVRANDLPPAMLGMTDAAGNFAFEYRGIYSSANTDRELNAIRASHNVDYDWALWGHNLRNVFSGKIPAEAFAIANGERTEDQFCFSSEALYKALKAYVRRQPAASDGDSLRFCIMPNDNDLVCLCPACKEAGNTASNATPAVTRLVERLAGEFPHCLFFTSSYLTTQTPPARPLPSNAGVMLSSMSLPLKAKADKTPQGKRFAKLVNDWKQVTGRIYVWDYMRNFDDYLTPYPCLLLLQERLRYLRDLGVKGVFLNGSGRDYASLDDVQTYALSCLLIDPDVSVDSCISRYARRFYPVTGRCLADAYTAWEHEAYRRGTTLLYYGGMGDAVKSWLEPAAFESVCVRMDSLSKKAEMPERTALNRLLTAWQFTRLELMRLSPADYDAARARTCLDLLRGHDAFIDMENYREARGALSDYITRWNRLIEAVKHADNPLRGVVPTAVSRLDAAYPDPAVLTDGFYGLGSDYHTGWLIASAPQTVLRLPSGKLQAAGTLECSFLYAPRWRILVPRTVEVWQEGVKLASVSVKPDEMPDPHTAYKLRIPLSGVQTGRPLEVRMIQGDDIKRPTLGCDEIRWLSAF